MTDKHFWRDDYFQALRDVATEASASPEWADYAAFCTEYERGLRPQAFAILDRFIESLERTSFAERRRFVSWLLNRADGHGGRHMLVPHPLQQRIVELTLKSGSRSSPPPLNRIAGWAATSISSAPSNSTRTTNSRIASLSRTFSVVWAYRPTNCLLATSAHHKRTWLFWTRRHCRACRAATTANSLPTASAISGH